jgi:hypothetical protein
VEELQWRLAERLQRLNDLGFDVGEVELTTSPEGAKLRVDTRVAEPGQHRRELFRLTGLEVQERQARRLLNDMRAFKAYLEQKSGGPVPESFAAQRWLAEVFHQVPEHRWFLSETAKRDIGMAEAARSYFDTVLPQTPKEVTTPSVIAELGPET